MSIRVTWDFHEFELQFFFLRINSAFLPSFKPTLFLFLMFIEWFFKSCTNSSQTTFSASYSAIMRTRALSDYNRQKVWPRKGTYVNGESRELLVAKSKSCDMRIAGHFLAHFMTPCEPSLIVAENREPYYFIIFCKCKEVPLSLFSYPMLASTLTIGPITPTECSSKLLAQATFMRQVSDYINNIKDKTS